jgi:hypothetical protein
MRSRLILPIVLVAAVAAIAGCGSSSGSSGSASNGSSATKSSGGSSTVSAAAYVKSVCTALGPVVTDLQSKEAAVASATTPQAAKSALQDFISSLSTGLGTAIPQVQAAGTPSVSNGSAIQSALVSAFTQLKTALAHASSQLGSIPTDNLAAFKAGFQSIATNLRSSTAGIKSGLQGLQSPELKSAAKAEPACAALKPAS